MGTEKCKLRTENDKISKGAAHKRCPQSGGVVQCGHFVDKGGSLVADVLTFWCKNSGFFEIYGVSASGIWKQ